MRLKLSCLGGFAIAAALAPANAANAATLGITAPPAGSIGTQCGTGQVIGQVTDDPATPYRVGPGGGKITQWQVNTTGATPGQSVTLVVLRAAIFNTYGVVQANAVTLPNPLPASHIATFNLATPIPVIDGDTLGLYTNSSTGLSCYWSGGVTPNGDSLTALTEGSAPAAGQTLSPAFGNSPPGFTMNVAAKLSVVIDAGVSESTSPSKPTAGNQALLSSTVTNHGPGNDAIIFSDTVPSGLKIDSVSAGNGACATSGQHITCTIRGLAVGSSVPVNVVVTPSSPGSYANTVAVSVPAEDTDPASANNSASATLHVGKAGPASCIVPRLKGTPAGVAKGVLKLLGCKVKVKRVKHGPVAKGLVIKTKPGAGTYALGKLVTLIVRK